MGSYGSLPVGAWGCPTTSHNITLLSVGSSHFGVTFGVPWVPSYWGRPTTSHNITPLSAGPPNMGSHLGSHCSPNQGCPPPPCSHHLPPLLPLLPPNPPRALGPLVSMGVGHDFGVPPSVPMAVGRVADQAHHFRRLDLAVGRRVALALVVTEDAVLQRAPAPAELCGPHGDEMGGNEDTHGHP